MNKLWLLLLIPVILVGFACVGNDDTVAADSLSAKLAAMQATILQHTTVIDSLKVDVEKKASKSEIDDLNRKINNLPQGGTSSDVYTKAQVDEKIAAAITVIKTDQAWIKSATHTTDAGTVAGEYGELVDTDGDLELWLEKTSGIATDNIRTTIAVNQMARFDFVVVNKDTTTAHDFKINLMFYPDSATTLDMATGKTRYSASGNATYTISRDQATPAAPNTNPLSLYQGNTSRVLKGDSDDYTVWLYIDQTATSAVDWDWTITIDDRD
jgi:hypothetical protein